MSASVIPPGVREREREAREFVPTHAVIDPVILHTPLDVASAVVFAVAFVAIAAASARRPAYGIAALIVLLPFGFPHELDHTTVTLDKVALLANVAGLIAGRRAHRPDLHVLGLAATRVLAVCGLAVLAATALSMLHALHHGPALRETLKAAQYLALFCVVAVATAVDPDEGPIRASLVAVAIVVSVLALAQEALGAPSGLWFANVAIPRIAGPLEGPNQLAGYLGILLALVVAFAIRPPRTQPRSRFELAALAIGSATLILTISRAGVFASLGGIAVVLAVSANAERRAAIAAIACGSLAGCVLIAFWGFAATHSMLGLSLLDRFGTLAEASDPGSVGTRSQLWHAALVLWRAHPIFGIGAGNFEWELGLAGYPQLHTHANSLYLQSLAEGGIPLALATAALVYASIARFARGPFSEPLVAAALGASAGFAAHQIFDLLVFYPKVGEMWWIALALAAARLDRRVR